MTRWPPATSFRTTPTIAWSKNCTSSMPTTVVSGNISCRISSPTSTGRASNESPSCELTSSLLKRMSMAGLKTCTARRAITARLTRRMSSSLFPLNIEPTITSRPAWVRVLIGGS